MKDDAPKSSDELSQDDKLFLAAAQRAVRRALIRHKNNGESIVIWENGAIRTIEAKDIEIPDEPATP